MYNSEQHVNVSVCVVGNYGEQDFVRTALKSANKMAAIRASRLYVHGDGHQKMCSNAVGSNAVVATTS
jgi:hypothetical protein